MFDNTLLWVIGGIASAIISSVGAIIYDKWKTRQEQKRLIAENEDLKEEKVDAVEHAQKEKYVQANPFSNVAAANKWMRERKNRK